MIPAFSECIGQGARILITGVSGLVGGAAAQAAVASGYRVVAPIRGRVGEPLVPGDVSGISAKSDSWQSAVEWHGGFDLRCRLDWMAVLSDVRFVIHAAAATPNASLSGSLSQADLRRVNVEATRELAIAARSAGVECMLLVSTLGVHGEYRNETPFSVRDSLAPYDTYTISKRDAEQAMQQALRGSKTTWVSVRPPWVYGSHAGHSSSSTFYRLIRVVQREFPLPLGSVNNRRSLIGANNLADFLMMVLRSPQAWTQPWLVADSEDMSTPALLREIAQIIGVRDRIFPCPQMPLRWITQALGRGRDFHRLCSSAYIDRSALADLGWRAPQTTRLELARAIGAVTARGNS